MTVVLCGLAALTVWSSAAAAQSRARTIQASATIVGGPNSDLLAAEALVFGTASSDASFAGTAATGDAWRITGSRGQQLSIQVETGNGAHGAAGPAVAICEQADDGGDETCRAHHAPAPALRVTVDGARPGIVVRVEPGPDTEVSPSPSVLVTVSYITG